jgi:hypothetical protein
LPDTAVYDDLLPILKRAARGSFVEFRVGGLHHVAPFDELFLKSDGDAVITHPEVYVDYGDGKYVEMMENEPTRHELNVHDSIFCWIGTPSFHNGHICVKGASGPFHIFLDGHAEMA